MVSSPWNDLSYGLFVTVACRVAYTHRQHAAEQPAR